jgi:hypothetical protein
MDMTAVEEDYRNDEGIQRLVEDVGVVVKDLVNLADGCECMIIFKRFFESLFGEGLIAMAVRFVINIVPISEDFAGFLDAIYEGNAYNVGLNIGKVFGKILL